MLWINFGAFSLSNPLASSNVDLKFTQIPNTQFCHSEPHPRLQLAFLICCQQHRFLLCTFCLLIFFKQIAVIPIKMCFLWPQSCFLKSTHDMEHLQKQVRCSLGKLRTCHEGSLMGLLTCMLHSTQSPLEGVH